LLSIQKKILKERLLTTIMPSEDLFQRLTAGATFNRTVNVFTKRFDLFLLISLMVFVPFVAMWITVFGYIGSSLHTFIDTMDLSNRYLQQTSYYNQTPDLDPAAFWDFTDQLIDNIDVIAGQLFVEWLLFSIFTIAAQAAMIYAVGKLYVNRDPCISECLKRGFSKWCSLFGASMLVLFTMYVGNYILASISRMLPPPPFQFSMFAAWMVFKIYVFVSLVILSPAVVVENLGPINGIKRAWDLANRNRCYIFCTLFYFGFKYCLLILVIIGIITNVFGKDAIFNAWGILVTMLPTIIFLPLACIWKTVVYLNIRVQREGMNHGVLMNDLEGMIKGEAVVVDMKEETYKDEDSKCTPSIESKENVV